MKPFVLQHSKEKKIELFPKIASLTDDLKSKVSVFLRIEMHAAQKSHYFQTLTHRLFRFQKRISIPCAYLDLVSSLDSNHIELLISSIAVYFVSDSHADAQYLYDRVVLTAYQITKPHNFFLFFVNTIKKIFHTQPINESIVVINNKAIAKFIVRSYFIFVLFVS